MKIRTDYITNSSSSSFVIVGRTVKMSDINLKSGYEYYMFGSDEAGEGQDLIKIDRVKVLERIKSIPRGLWGSNWSIWEALATAWDGKVINVDKENLQRWIEEGKPIKVIGCEVDIHDPLSEGSEDYFNSTYHSTYLGIDEEAKREEEEEREQLKRLKEKYENKK